MRAHRVPNRRNGPRPRARTAAVALIAALCGVAPALGLARAAPPAADEATVRARELFLEGTKLFAAPQWPRAHDAFATAWALKRQYQIAANLGACEVLLGRYRDAAEHLSFYMREANRAPDVPDEERRAAAANLEQALAHVATLEVQVDA